MASYFRGRDNPAVFDGGSTETLFFLASMVEPIHTEYRDDRFVAAFAREENRRDEPI